MSIKICIADGQTRVRYGLRILLEQQPEWYVAGEAEDAQELFKVLDSSHPDLVLLDWHLPGIPPRELLTMLRNAHPSIYVITLSGQNEVRQAALAAGADAFISKTDFPGRLIALIQELQIDGSL